MSTLLRNNCPSRTANSRATHLSSVYCSDVFYLPDYTHRCTGGSNTLCFSMVALLCCCRTVTSSSFLSSTSSLIIKQCLVPDLHNFLNYTFFLFLLSFLFRILFHLNLLLLLLLIYLWLFFFCLLFSSSFSIFLSCCCKK